MGMFKPSVQIVPAQQHVSPHHWVQGASNHWYYVRADGEVLAEITHIGELFYVTHGSKYMTLAQAQQVVERG